MFDIGIVGLGNIGNNHARCYEANELSRVAAVCDIIETTLTAINSNDATVGKDTTR